MLIQFDREDSENLVLTFDNSESDVEQMEDFIDWLKSSGLEFSKLKMKVPGVAEKVTNVFVKKPEPVEQAKPVLTKSVPEPVKTVQTKSAPVKPVEAVKPVKPVEAVEPVEVVEAEEDSDTKEVANVVAATAQSANAAESSDESESESEDEPVSRTKKTTKRVTNSRK